jgi:Ethanolamine utilization protein EutJ (predicted chaperonin)
MEVMKIMAERIRRDAVVWSYFSLYSIEREIVNRRMLIRLSRQVQIQFTFKARKIPAAVRDVARRLVEWKEASRANFEISATRMNKQI